MLQQSVAVTLPTPKHTLAYVLAVDASPDLCWALVEPGPAKPPLLPELYAFMTSPPEAKVPITRRAMQLISGQQLAAHFSVADGCLADVVGYSICFQETVESEIDTAILEHITVVQVTTPAGW